MSNPWLQLKQNLPDAVTNLLCLPFAGGFAEYYLLWRKHLPHSLQLCPLQLPGRSYRWQEPPYTHIQHLLTDLLPSLLLDDKPYILFGHSMGGYIAYEMCKMFSKRNLSLPKLLVVSSLPAPIHWPARQKLSELTDQEFSDFFVKLGGFHPELLKDKNFMRSQMSLLRKDITLCETCEYSKPAAFSFPILALGGYGDEYVNLDHMQQWQLETKQDFQLQGFDGNHFYLNAHMDKVIKLIHGMAPLSLPGMSTPIA